MTLYETWLDRANEDKYSPEQITEYIREYYLKEKDAYAKILEAKQTKVSGTVAELAKEFGMEAYEVTAFVDGINTSLEAEVKPDDLTEESQVELNIIWDKLYYNMHKAKAAWLYELEQWDGILSQEERNEIAKQYKADVQAVSTKVGRNDPCPCGSGLKYKKCCGK